MGAGKTAAGEALSRRLGWRFVDLDARVEAQQGRRIAEIFATGGEAGFRRAEATALREVLAELEQSATVVALGGGTFAEPQNIAAVQDAGATVFLEASLGVLRERAGAAGQTRPLLGSEPDFARLYGERIASYRRAGVTVNTENKSAAEVAAEIAHRLGLEES